MVWIRSKSGEMPDLSWMEKARCRDLQKEQRDEMFFPERSAPHKAKIMCLGVEPTKSKKVQTPCPVQKECLEYSLFLPAGETVGIWAGYTEAERRSLRNQQDSQRA